MTTAVPIAFLYEPLLTMTAFPCFIHSASWSMSLMFTICSKQSSAVVLCCKNMTKFGGRCIAFCVIGPVPVQIHKSRHRNTVATSMDWGATVMVPLWEYMGRYWRSLVSGYRSHPVSIFLYRFLSCGEKNHSHSVSTLSQSPKGCLSLLPLPRKHLFR